VSERERERERRGEKKQRGMGIGETEWHLRAERAAGGNRVALVEREVLCGLDWTELN
jgi:hypothetical protein